MSLASEVLGESLKASSRRGEVCMPHELLHTLLIAMQWRAEATQVVARYFWDEARFTERPVGAWSAHYADWTDLPGVDLPHTLVHWPRSAGEPRATRALYVQVGAHLSPTANDDTITLITDWRISWVGLPQRAGAKDYATITLPIGTSVTDAVRIARIIGARVNVGWDKLARLVPDMVTPVCLDGYAAHQ
jgi:hypothetical protein